MTISVKLVVIEVSVVLFVGPIISTSALAWNMT